MCNRLLSDDPTPAADAFTGGRVLRGSAAGGVSAAGRIATAAGGRGYRLARPHGPSDPGIGKRPPRGPLLVFAAWTGVVRLGMVSRRGICARLAVAGDRRGGNAGRRHAVSGGGGALALAAPPRSGSVACGGGHAGGVQRIERPLSRAAARFLDPLVPALLVGAR